MRSALAREMKTGPTGTLSTWRAGNPERSRRNERLNVIPDHEGKHRMADPTSQVCVYNTAPVHFDGISKLCRRIYPDTPPWNAEQLSSHLRVFPEGQCVAV